MQFTGSFSLRSKIAWTIKNEGTSGYSKFLSVPFRKPWTDRLYISRNSVYDNTAVWLNTAGNNSNDNLPLPYITVVFNGSNVGYGVTNGYVSAGIPNAPTYYFLPQTFSLGIDSSLTQTGRYALPIRTNGTYYVHVRTNYYNDIYEANLDGDNIASSVVLE